MLTLVSLLTLGLSAGAATAAPDPAAAGSSQTAADLRASGPIGAMDFGTCKDEPILAQPAGATAEVPGYLYARCKNFDDCDDYGTYLYLWIGIISDYDCSKFGDEWWLYVY